jgi:FtsP/CotA-like multicopper oxidase with cupredoxin domain
MNRKGEICTIALKSLAEMDRRVIGNGKRLPLLNRRQLLAGAGLALSALPCLAQSSFKTLRVTNRTLEVLKKPAEVFVIEGADKLNLVAGGRFSLRLVNDQPEGTIVHWHGLTPPSALDGSNLSQGIIKHGSSFEYDFVNERGGTFWMHSHVGLQAQKLLAAPLIVRSPEDFALDEQEHVVMLHDFTFRDPQEIFEELKAGKGAHAGHSGHGAASLNDIAFDAYLANDRTLEDPEIVRVEPAGRVRLRVINASAASNMMIDLGALEAELIAVDGNAIEAIRATSFGLAMAQRADIRITLPPGHGAYPILARPEGTSLRTGIILATEGAPITMVESEGEPMGAVTDIALESRLKALKGLAEKMPERVETFDLGGGEADYAWNINGNSDHSGVIAQVRLGERVEWTLRNQTSMSHPMHLHGHHFQIIAIGGTRFEGAMRDTVLVPAKEDVTIAFDADNSGRWPFHCHHLYHFNAGMAGAVEYIS